MTGQDFLIYCKSIDDEAFSDYTPGGQFDVLAQAALSKCVEMRYTTNDRQQIADDLFSLTVTDFSQIPVNNRIPISLITDYLHLLAVRPFFEEKIDLTITNVTTTSPIRITVNKRSKLRGVAGAASLVKTTSIGGVITANTTAYLKQLNDFQYAMYRDVRLTNPISGVGTYTSGGAISLIHANWAKPLDSSARISELSTPTIENPRYEIANSSVSIFPSDNTDYPCYLAQIDYLKKPIVFILSQDNTIDLELSYTKRFLYFVADKMKQIIKESQSDYQAASAATKELGLP